MSRVTPFQLGFEVDDSLLAPGTIFRKLDGTLWKVDPNGSQSPLSSGGAGAWGEAATAQFTGSGSPVGVVTPNGEGDLYVDSDTPALWQATGVTNTDWALSGGGSQAVLSATVVVSSAEILALVDTPVQLVAAPASGHALVPLQIISALSESDYLNENAQVQLAWGPEWDAANGLSSVDSMLVAGSGAQFGVDFPTAQTDSPSAFDGLPLVLGSGGDPFTDGTGVLKITVLYALVASS